MGERAPATFWERRVLGQERTIIAACITVVAIYLPDRTQGVALFGLVVVTLIIVKLATPRGWQGPTKRALGTVMVWWVAATLVPTGLPLWVPTVVVLLLGPVPFLVNILGLIVLDEESSGRSLMFWVMLSFLQRGLRVVAVLLAWIVTLWTSGNLGAALLLAPAALATAVGWPSVGLVVLALATPFVGGSSTWWAVGAITIIVALSHRRVRPPRQAVGLPMSAALSGHPLLRRRVRRIDRLLERSAWARAEAAGASMLEPSGPLTTTAALRVARARLEQGHLQGARDALDIAWSDGSLAVGGAVRRLQGETLTRGAQPLAALEALNEARFMLPYDRDHQARVALAAASALVDAGQYADAVHQASIAARWFRRPRDLVAQFRAARLLTLAHWKLDELDEALAAIESTLGIGVSTRWMRQYGLAGGHVRDDEELIFSDDSVLLVEFARLQVLELQIKLDPRLDSAQADESESAQAELNREDLYHDLETYSVLLDVGGAGLDRAEVDLFRADVHAADGHAPAALHSALSAVIELDEVRHSLRAQADRAAWARTFNRALAIALESAAAGEDSVRVAELIELARVQAFPLLRAGRAPDEVALQAPPTVRVRGTASIGRGGTRSADHDSARPIDLEHAAACAVGLEAWWLSFFHDGSTLTWAVVPPSGTTHHGRIHGHDYLDLRLALHELDRNLPVRLGGEDDADVDIRLFSAAFRKDPDAEARLSARLAGMLLPDVLQKAALSRQQSGRPLLRLAIAPDPLLAHVPWSLLVVDPAIEPNAHSTRLTEVAVWSLAPSATLLVLAGDRPAQDSPAPLRLAVLDPADVPALPAARAMADHLDGVKVLGGRHWHVEPATPRAVLEAIASVGAASTVLFGCHASQGDAARPSSSALVLAATHPGGQGEPLTAGALLGSGVPRESFPAQVSLQACDTSDLSGAAGGEWLSLAPAFLAAGARVVGTTQFPLVDIAGVDADGGPGRLLAGLMKGEGLAELVRSEQIEGLTRWRCHDGPVAPPIEDTPLAWASHAVCSTGRAGQVAPKGEPLRVSSGLVQTLVRAAMSGTKSSNRTVNSADVLAVYLENDTEMITGSIPSVLTRASLLAVLPRLLRAARSPGPSRGVRPSAELLSAARRAGAGSSTTGWLHPEHLVLAVLDGPVSPGRRMLSALRLRKGSSLRNALRTNLREAYLRTPSRGDEVRPEIQSFVDEVVEAAQAGIDDAADKAEPGGLSQSRSESLRLESQRMIRRGGEVGRGGV